MTDEAIISELQQIRRDQKKILAFLSGEKKPKYWVKATDILKMTGWSKETLRLRRVNGLVEFKKTDKGFFYNPASIHPHLIRHENTTPKKVTA